MVATNMAPECQKVMNNIAHFFIQNRSTLRKNFIQQKVIRIGQRTCVNFWIFGFGYFLTNSKIVQKILKKFTRFLWSILSTFCSIKFFCKVETFG